MNGGQNLSKFDQSLQEKQMLERAFDLFEFPMQKWVAQLLKVEQYPLFEKAPQDNLMFEEHNKKWVLELVQHLPAAEGSLYDVQYWKINRSAKYESAVRMLLQAVPKIFMAFKLMFAKNKDLTQVLNHFVPQFDARSMCFFWTAQNPEEQIHMQLIITKLNIEKSYTSNSLSNDSANDSANGSANSLVMKDEDKKKLEDIEEELKKIDFAEVQKSHEFIQEHAELLKNPRLYIRFREMAAADRELLLARIAHTSAAGITKYSDV